MKTVHMAAMMEILQGDKSRDRINYFNARGLHCKNSHEKSVCFECATLILRLQHLVSLGKTRIFGFAHRHGFWILERLINNVAFSYAWKCPLKIWKIYLLYWMRCIDSTIHASHGRNADSAKSPLMPLVSTIFQKSTLSENCCLYVINYAESIFEVGFEVSWNSRTSLRKNEFL